MSDTWVLFLHGINASTEDHWRLPLDQALVRAGQEPIDPARVLTPDYRAALRGEAEGSSAVRATWKRPDKDSLRKAQTSYVARMAFLESQLRPIANGVPAWVQPPELATVPTLGALLDDARNYARSAEVRAAVHSIVLASLEAVPAGSRVVILAHSLGSVVAADIVKKLPEGLHIPVLVTIGSPLGAITEFRGRDLDEYPFDRLGAWVNIFDPRDPVTGGRGIGDRFRWVVDVAVTLQDWMFPVLIHQHGGEYYCAHAAVASAIVLALVGTDVARAAVEGSDAARGLELALLQSLYLRELSKRLPADLDRLARFERVRRVVAADNSAAAAVLHAADASTAPLQPSDFLQRPETHIRGAWADRTLIALAIMLASGNPAPPFDIEAKPDTDERRRALVSTLSLVRANKSEPTDVDIVDAIFSARKSVDDYLAPGLSWVPVALIAGGVITLAATGVGLAAVIPAGLAGAAVITTTLAAFGPGGMMGGLATLAALAGAGAGMAGVGAGAAIGANGVVKVAPDLFSQALDEAIAASGSESLRSLLASVLTLVDVQEKLEFPTQRDQMLQACLNAKAQLASRIGEHELIDPKSSSAKTAREKLALLEKACQWLRGEERAESSDALELQRIATAYREALVGREERFHALLVGPGRSHMNEDRTAIESFDD
ncbi:hypothetical protein [Microbacterium sp.]|uniref:hypothetical protein n=1 Tax=Microbacterium sp. TaxID=51671 RepID=UPI003C79711C